MLNEFGLISVCFDDTGNESPQACKALYLGQMLPSGTATANTAVKVTSAKNATALFGAGSQLEFASRLHFGKDIGYVTELWAIPFADPAGAVKAEYEVTATGLATESGILSFQFGMNTYRIAIIATDAATVIGAKIAAAINANQQELYTALNVAGVVTFVAKNGGTISNGLTFKPNPLTGDKTPAGIALSALTLTVTGVGDNDHSTVVPLAVGSCKYDCIADLSASQLNHEFLASFIRARWACGTQQKYGHGYYAMKATTGTIVTDGEALNDETTTIIPVPANYHIPFWAFPAVWATTNCMNACRETTRPAQYKNGLLTGLVDASLCGGVWTTEEKTAFYNAGVAVWDVSNTSGYKATLWIEANITNAKRGETGRPTSVWKTVESRYTWARFAQEERDFMFNEYNSTALKNNGAPLTEGRSQTTAKIMEATLNSRFLTRHGGDFEVTAGKPLPFKVVRDTDGKDCGVGNPNQVNISVSPNAAEQILRINLNISVKIENC